MTDPIVPSSPAPPAPTPLDRAKAAVDAMNKQVGADIHDRMHAQAAAITAIADALFPPGG